MSCDVGLREQWTVKAVCCDVGLAEHCAVNAESCNVGLVEHCTVKAVSCDVGLVEQCTETAVSCDVGLVEHFAEMRSYPMSKVRGGSCERQAATAQEQPREDTHIRGQGQRPGGANPCTRPGASSKRSNPRSNEQWLRGHRRAERSYSMFKVRSSSSEEMPLIQGKEQQLCFAGAAMKRYPKSKNPNKMVGVARGHQRADTLKPYSQETCQSNHTRTTALSNSMKLSHALWGHPRHAGHGGEV